MPCLPWSRPGSRTGARRPGGFARTRRGLPLVLVLALLSAPAVAQPTAPAGGRVALLLSLEGGIGPGSAGYLTEALDRAAAEGAALVVLRLDTPGGLDAATRGMVQAILASPVPVAAWVGPRGARAASAGLFLLSAAPVAAMAPGTATGAATPVRLGGGGGEIEVSPSQAKAVNDAAAYVRGLAAYHGRNPDWVEKAVREAASVPAEEALRLGVVDLLAADLPALLAAMDGRRVRLPAGEAVLATRDLALRRLDPGWRHRLLAFLSDPNIAFLLLMVGLYGLVLEAATPGVGLGGVVGSIALVLGLFAVGMLPVQATGIALMALGAALLAAEAFVPAFDLLGVGGLAALALGGAVAFDFDVPGFHLSPAVLAATVAVGGLLLLLTLRVAWRARRRPVVTGAQGMIGTRGRVLAWEDGHGAVLVHGERWAATAAPAAVLTPGQAVRVRGRQGLTLQVEPAGPGEEGSDHER